jgi:hypothetical protein
LTFGFRSSRERDTASNASSSEELVSFFMRTICGFILCVAALLGVGLGTVDSAAGLTIVAVSLSEDGHVGFF